MPLYEKTLGCFTCCAHFQIWMARIILPLQVSPSSSDVHGPHAELVSPSVMRLSVNPRPFAGSGGSPSGFWIPRRYDDKFRHDFDALMAAVLAARRHFGPGFPIIWVDASVLKSWARVAPCYQRPATRGHGLWANAVLLHLVRRSILYTGRILFQARKAEHRHPGTRIRALQFIDAWTPRCTALHVLCSTHSSEGEHATPSATGDIATEGAPQLALGALQRAIYGLTSAQIHIRGAQRPPFNLTIRNEPAQPET